MTTMPSLMGGFEQVPCMEYLADIDDRVHSIDIKTSLSILIQKTPIKTIKIMQLYVSSKISDLHCMLTENKVWNKRTTFTNVVIFSFRRSVQRVLTQFTDVEPSFCYKSDACYGSYKLLLTHDDDPNFADPLFLSLASRPTTLLFPPSTTVWICFTRMMKCWCAFGTWQLATCYWSKSTVCVCSFDESVHTKFKF